VCWTPVYFRPLALFYEDIRADILLHVHTGYIRKALQCQGTYIIYTQRPGRLDSSLTK